MMHKLFIYKHIDMVCVLLLLAMAGPTYAANWVFKQLTSNDVSDRGPQISGNIVLWSSYLNDGYKNLVRLDLNSMNVEDITTGKVPRGYVAGQTINGDTIAFRVYDWNAKIQRYYVLKDDTYINIFNAAPGSFPPFKGFPPSHWSLDPNTYNGKVVFAVWDGNDYEIMLWNDGEITQITNNDTDDYEPQINSGGVCWTGWGGDDNTKKDVFYWNGETILNVSKNHHNTDEDSYIWGDNIYWVGIAYDHADPYFDVYTNKNGEIEHVYFLEGNDFEPVAFGNVISWTHRDESLPDRKQYSTVVYDGMNLFYLDVGEYDELEPAIDKNNIVFCAWDGHDYEIWLATYLADCKGDFKRDGDVDADDLNAFSVNFGRTNCESADCESDFEEDGDVDGMDLNVFSADYGRSDCP